MTSHCGLYHITIFQNVRNVRFVPLKLSGVSDLLILLTKGKTMSANLYSIEDLLVGKVYRSRSVSGEIISAEKHPQAVWYDGAEAYLVNIRKDNGGYTYRSVAVSV